jgi:predicted permease
MNGIAMVVLVIIDLLITRQILPRGREAEDIMFILTVIICYGVGSWLFFKFTERISSRIRNRSRFFKLVKSSQS